MGVALRLVCLGVERGERRTVAYCECVSDIRNGNHFYCKWQMHCISKKSAMMGGRSAYATHKSC